MTEQAAAEFTRRWARFYFRRLPLVRGSLEYLGANEQKRVKRVDTFEQVIGRMNYLLDHPAEISATMEDVRTLKDTLNGQKIPSLESILSQTRSSEQIAESVNQTFEFGKKDFPSWANEPFDQQGTAASSILLEGFGYYLGTVIHGHDEGKVMKTKRAFVRGFEEVLLVEHEQSPLTRDIMVWMKGEIQDFPSAIRGRITAYK